MSGNFKPLERTSENNPLRVFNVQLLVLRLDEISQILQSLTTVQVQQVVDRLISKISNLLQNHLEFLYFVGRDLP